MCLLKYCIPWLTISVNPFSVYGKILYWFVGNTCLKGFWRINHRFFVDFTIVLRILNYLQSPFMSIDGCRVSKNISRGFSNAIAVYEVEFIYFF